MQASIDWEFADECSRAVSIDEIRGLFMREIRALGFSYAACASHVDPLRPPPGAVIMLDYPRAWLERFSAMRYALRDPVFLAAKKQALPFRWSDPRFRDPLATDQVRILNEAAEVGLADGITIPIHAPDALPASCSLAIGPDGVDPLHVRDAQWVAFYAHETARRLLLQLAPPPRPVLSPRERECIALVAQGKSDYEIGVILDLSEHTVHNTVRRAMRKYGVATRIQVFARALHDGEIQIEDIAN